MHRAADFPWTLAHRVAALVGAMLAVAMGCDGGARAAERGADVARVPSIVRSETRRFLVHFEDVVRNEGAEPLRDVRCDLLLPLDDERQTVRWLRLSPHGWRIHTDVHGERVASASLAALAPGDATTFSWIASVELAEERHAPDADATRAPPPPDVRRYLADGPCFRLSSEAVRVAAEEVELAAGDASALALVRAAAAYVRTHVAYACEGGWDPAPTVLARGNGSCTEATYAFVAIFRRLHVPARWIGGTVRRGLPSGRGLDTMFHRMAQAWIPGHGWLPVEPTRGRVEGDGVGRISGAMLELAVGDGSGAAGTGSSYFARDRWEAGPDGRASPAGRAACRAYWLPGIEDGFATTHTRREGDHADPSPMSLAAILACDARGFGPVLDADARPIAGAAPPSVPRRIDAARTLLAAGEPDGVRLLAEASPAHAEEAAGVLWSGCDASLAAEIAPLLARNRSSFEGWWTRNLRRVSPRDHGRLRLAATTPP
jgi:transglutaminase-like putative cysteine protease